MFNLHAIQCGLWLWLGRISTDGVKKVKSFPILVTERWAGADPGVQAFSPQVT